jgi:TrmH family RNA methyltransferase
VSLTRRELKDIKSLLTRKGRREQGKFLAEGVRLLEEAVRFRFWPQKVYYSTALLSERGERLLREFGRRAIVPMEISARELAGMADARTPQGIVAVFGTPETSLIKLYRRSHRTLLLCENIADPGNLGTLMRSAAAFGFDLVVLSGNTAEPYSPKVVRGSAGSIFGLSVAKSDLQTLIAFLGRSGIKLVAADLEGRPARLPGRGALAKVGLMLAIGSEATGLSEEIRAQAGYRIRIEHSDKVESLNAAVAGSILMKRIYDHYRR